MTPSPSILALAREIVELTHHGSLRWETTRDQVAAILMRREVDWAHEYALLVDAMPPEFSDQVPARPDAIDRATDHDCIEAEVRIWRLQRLWDETEKDRLTLLAAALALVIPGRQPKGHGTERDDLVGDPLRCVCRWCAIARLFSKDAPRG